MHTIGDSLPFDFFRQEASHADVVVRTEAMSKLLIIATLMTPEKVRNDMIPFLISMFRAIISTLLTMVAS